MANRIELQTKLEDILGSRNVYYQPPESLKMKYPAIVYKRNSIEKRNADDVAYTMLTSYSIILIDSNPDSDVVYKIASLPMCKHTSHYVADNLNHDQFTLYF